MSKKKKKPYPQTGPFYAHNNGCFPLERLFKKHLVEAISKRVVDNKTIFTLHETYSPKHSLEKQTGGRWNISSRAEVLKAIELAKKRKDVLMVEEAG